MTPHAGRFGRLAVADQVSRKYLVKHRIRLTSSTPAANPEVQRFIAGLKACPTTNPEVSVTGSPRYPTYFKIVSGLGSEHQLVSWVAVTVNEHTPNADSTIFRYGSTEPRPACSSASPFAWQPTSGPERLTTAAAVNDGVSQRDPLPGCGPVADVTLAVGSLRSARWSAAGR